MIPKPVPTDEYLLHIWQSYKDGSITLTEVQEMQAKKMPRCAAHDQPCNIRIAGVPLCVECMRERYEHV